MLILSKFHDYYDTAMGAGIDKTIVFNRSEEEINISHDKTRFNFIDINVQRIYESAYERYGYMNKTYPDVYYEPFIIGFCGKTYVGYRVDTYTNNPNICTGPEKTSKYLYGDEAHKFVLSKYNHKKNKEVRHYVNDLFTKYHNKKNYSDIFIDNKIPMFVLDDIRISGWLNDAKAYATTIVLNPMLKNYSFVKMFDPYTAFQEIQMYISGVLGTGGKELIQIEEKYRQAQAGMDKTSFRYYDTPARKHKKKK